MMAHLLCFVLLMILLPDRGVVCRLTPSKASRESPLFVVDKGEDGVLYNIIRTPERIIREAQSARLGLLRHRKIHAKEHADYKPGQENRVILYLFEFAAA